MQTGPQQCYFYLIVECILLMPPSPFDAIAIYCNCCCFGKGGDHEAFLKLLLLDSLSCDKSGMVYFGRHDALFIFPPCTNSTSTHQNLCKRYA